MESRDIDKIIALIKREVIPALGCTEPIAVALAAAKAKEILGEIPSEIEVYLSANVLKNAMGVGIPGTGMIGLPIAVALGVLIGDSSLNLEVLRDADAEAVSEGKKMIDNGKILIALKPDIVEKLYIEVVCRTKNHHSKTIISGEHTRFTFLSKDDNIILSTSEINEINESTDDDPVLSMNKVYEFATTAPLDSIRFMLETARINKNAAEISFQGNYGHALGKTLMMARQKPLLGDSLLCKILSYTSAACDARMAGAMIQVMSNSGSGNQGITATLPVVIYAEEYKCSEEELIRALTLSHLTVIYIKQSLGRLSALCGCVVAAIGSSCALTYLMGGTYEQIGYTVKNMVANLAGMLCDGAKPSCALKLASGVSTAVLSAMLAMECKYVTSVEGIVDEDVDQSIRNLTRIGADAMAETDKMVLDIMCNKKGCN
ncbi:MAG: serine dehydratase subunit alpha family protein [Bacteroidales bacterium]